MAVCEVLVTSPWIPPEWIKAHGFQPRGIWAGLGSGRSPLPLSAGVCAFAESVLALAKNQPASAIVFATACDQMRRAFDELLAARTKPNLPAFLFNLPSACQSPIARRLFHAEMERLGRFLRSIGGHDPAEDLPGVMAEYGRARNQLRAMVPRSSGRQMAQALADYQWAGAAKPPHPTATPATKAIPLAVAGGPLPPSQWELLDTIETAGGRIVLNATEMGERSLVPSPTLGERIDLSVVADLYFDGCVDVFQRPDTRLYAWLSERLAPRKARGIVLWHYLGCDLWRAEAPRLRKEFGLPLLALDTDEAQSHSPRMASRIQAFVEMLQ